MSKFRLNTHRGKTSLCFEVHEESCSQYHLLKHFVELGEFVFCSTAVQRARELGYKDVDGCKICCKACHRGYN